MIVEGEEALKGLMSNVYRVVRGLPRTGPGGTGGTVPGPRAGEGETPELRLHPGRKKREVIDNGWGASFGDQFRLGA